MRRAKPSGRPTTRVRKVLTDLGYTEHEDFDYEVEIRLYGNRRLYADVMLFHNETPLALVEVEGKANQLAEGYEEARIKGALWNLENPVPLLWVAAGNQDALYILNRAKGYIQYKPLNNVTLSQLLQLNNLHRRLASYLKRSSSSLGAELRYRALLQNAINAVRGGGLHARFHRWLNILKNSSPPPRGGNPLRTAQQTVQQALKRHQPDFPLAFALRHVARIYFRPQTAGNAVRRAGRFYTPSEVIQLIVEALDPRPKETIIDMACGSGGFLVHAARYLIEQYQASPKSVAGQIWGYDIDDTCCSLATLVLQLGIGHSVNHISQRNSLKHHWEEQYDVVLCNPPAGDIVAFAELAVRLAKPGARIGLIVPEGLLGRTSLKPFRQWLFREARPFAVLGLPRGLFPYTPSKMYAMLMTRSSSKQRAKCILADLTRAELSVNRRQLVTLLREVQHA